MTNILSQKAILANVTIRCWTGRKLDRRITDEVNQQHNAEADAGRYNKLLISREAFAEIYQICTAARQAHHVMTLPWFDEGARILPTTMYDQFATRFHTFRNEFEDAARRFDTAYPNYVNAAKKRLNGMFNAADYPAPNRVRSMFAFEVSVLPCPDATDFRVSLAKEQLDDLRTDVDARMRITLEEAMKEPIRRIITVVERMSVRLKGYQPAMNGERAQSTFRDSLVGNIRELLPLLDAFNLTGDKALTALTNRVELELCKNDAEILREDDKVRKAVAKAADDILKQANALMA